MSEVLLSIGGGSGGAIKAPQRLETVENGTHPAVAADGPRDEIRFKRTASEQRQSLVDVFPATQ